MPSIYEEIAKAGEEILKAGVSALGKQAVQETMPDRSIVAKIRNAAVGGMFGSILWKALKSYYNFANSVTVRDPRTGDLITFKNQAEFNEWQKGLTEAELEKLVESIEENEMMVRAGTMY